MADLHGEDSVVGFFDRYLGNEIKRKHDDDAYAIGRWQGTLDKQFGDFFAGVRARNILIEFKNGKYEISSELRDKPSQRKLCEGLSDIRDKVSKTCHFIGFDQGDCETDINLSQYYFTVCSKSKNLNKLAQKKLSDKIINSNHVQFVENFLDGKIGAYFGDFKKYLDYLLVNWDEGKVDSEDYFKATVVSYDPDGRLLSTKISSYEELKKISNVNLPKQTSAKENKKDKGSRFKFK